MKKMAEIIEKTGAFSAGSAICIICWAPRGRTEVILDPNKVPRHNRTSTWPPFLSVLRCQRGPLNTNKCVVSYCKMNDSVFLCITSTVKAVERIGDEKDGRNPWENWCFFCSLSDLYYFLSTRGAAQRWFWTPTRSTGPIAPRPNLRFSLVKLRFGVF